MTADRLGITGEAPRQLGGVAGHHAPPRALALCCAKVVDRPQDSAQSRLRNITLDATYSVLCAVEHKADSATGQHGDLLDLIALNRGFDRLRDTLDEARTFLALPPDQIAPRLQRLPAPRGSPESARRLYAMSRPITGTLAQAYLHSRGITTVAHDDPLRFHPRCYYRPDEDSPTETWPALIAAVTDLGGTVTGAHRTWLDPSGRDKAPIASPRRAMGHLLGHGVRFGMAADVMAAGEGIETMLSLRMILPTLPMVAALSANHLAALLLPPTLRRLYVARDTDPAGDSATASLCTRAEAAGIEPFVLSPCLDDFNDDLRYRGIEWLRASVRRQLAPPDVARFLALVREGMSTGA